MSKKAWIIALVVACIALLILSNNWDVFFPPKVLTVAEKQKVDAFKDSVSRKDELIVENEWIPYMSTKDSTTILKVVYQEKYGSLITIYCRAIFDNKKTGEYRCTAPWLEKYSIQKSNLVSFYPKVVPSEEFKE